MRTVIGIETYPDMFLDYETGEENPEYDDTLRKFIVPEQWLREWLDQNGLTMEWLENASTWDDTFDIFLKAGDDDVIIDEYICDR